MYRPKLEDLESRDAIFTIEESRTFVKVVADRAGDGSIPQLYLESAATDQVGASLTPVQAFLLHDAIGVWLRAYAESRGDDTFDGELQRQAQLLADAHYPHGQCDGCGWAVDEEHTCPNPDCRQSPAFRRHA